MKVSQIKKDDLARYCKVDLEQLEDDEREQEEKDFDIFLKVAKEFIKNYTGMSDKEIDNYEDFVIVIFILVNDMHDTRTFAIDKTNINVVVSTILGFHDDNLL